MIKSKKICTIAVSVLALVLCCTVLYSCGGNNTIPTTTTVKSEIGDSLDGVNKDFSDEDISSGYNESGASKIAFSSDKATVGMGAQANGTDVTVTNAGTFVVSGSCADGSITVSAGKDASVRLVLSGVELCNADGPVILVKNAKKVTITLAEGTTNTISDTAGYSMSDGNTVIDAAIFSKKDLVINGDGTLVVNGNNAHGIVSKDNLQITGGNIEVTSASAGICGKDSLKIMGASIKVKAGSDALRSDNDTDAGMGFIYIKSGNFDLYCNNDAVQAYGIANIEGGTFKITTTSTSTLESAKGIKGVGGVKISGGELDITSEDDAIHSDASILISGGNMTVSSGDDGIHANDTLEICGGNIVIKNSYEGIEATDIFIMNGYVDITSSDDGINASGGNDTSTNTGGRPGDMFGEPTNGSVNVSGGYVIMHIEGDGVDANGSFNVSGGVVLVDGPSRGGNGTMDYAGEATITGGTVVMLGTSDMAQNFSRAEQGSVLVSSNGYFPAGTVMSICDEDGNVILAFTATKQFNGALFSAPEIEKGKTYTFYMNADVSGLDENGYAHSTTQAGGEACGEVTLDDYICGQGSGMGGGMPSGGRPGGRPW